MTTLHIKVIKTEIEYLKVLRAIEAIFSSKPNTPEGDQLELLTQLIERYENAHYS